MRRQQDEVRRRAVVAAVGRGLLAGIFIAVCVPSVAAAVHRIDGVVGDPTFRHGAVALYAVLRAAVALAFATFVLLRGPARHPARDVRAFLWCTVALGSIVVIGKPSATAPVALVVVGEVVALTGVAWTLASVLTLRRCFSILPEARGLVTHGPYRFVRHPVYLGEIAMCAGLVVAAPSLRNAVAASVFVLAQARRMGMEEAALKAAFPEYEDYERTTRRLIPRLRPAPQPATWMSSRSATAGIPSSRV